MSKSTTTLVSTETQPAPILTGPMYSFQELKEIAGAIAESRMFGVSSTEQAIVLCLLCQSEGLHPAMAVRRYHIVKSDNGAKPTMRADAMLGEFEARGGKVIWHVRSSEEVSATFFARGTVVDKAALDRAKKRRKAIIDGKPDEEAELSVIGENTIVRTLKEAESSGIATTYNERGEAVYKKNWERDSRAMLTARCITEGVRVTDAGLIAGIYSPDEAQDILAQEALLNAETEEASKGIRKTFDIQTMERIKAASEKAAEEAAQAGDPVEAAAQAQKAEEMQTRINRAEKGTHTTEELNGPVTTAGNWVEAVCRYGSAGGPVHNLTMGQICGPEVKPKRATKLLEWLEAEIAPTLQNNLAALGSKADPEDAKLLGGIRAARAYWNDRMEKELAARENAVPETASTTQPKATPVATEVVPKSQDLPAVKNITEKPVRTKSLTWRDATVPFKCKMEGQTLGNLEPIGDYGPLVIFEAIENQILNAREIFDSIDPKEANAFKVAWLAGKEELCLGMDKKAVLQKVRDLAGDLAVSEDGICGHLEKLRVLPETKSEKKHFANYSEQDLRDLIRRWPDVDNEIRSEFNLLLPGEKA